MRNLIISTIVAAVAAVSFTIPSHAGNEGWGNGNGFGDKSFGYQDKGYGDKFDGFGKFKKYLRQNGHFQSSWGGYDEEARAK